MAVSKGGITGQFGGKIECTPHNRDDALHDRGGARYPERSVTVLDAIRASLRWKMRQRTRRRRR